MTLVNKSDVQSMSFIISLCAFATESYKKIQTRVFYQEILPTVKEYFFKNLWLTAPKGATSQLDSVIDWWMVA